MSFLFNVYLPLPVTATNADFLVIRVSSSRKKQTIAQLTIILYSKKSPTNSYVLRLDCEQEKGSYCLN